MAAINLNADHFKGWSYISSTESRCPAVRVPPSRPAVQCDQFLWINRPNPGMGRVHDEMARVMACAPEVARRACDLLEGLDTVNLPQSMAARVRKLREALAKSCG